MVTPVQALRDEGGEVGEEAVVQRVLGAGIVVAGGGEGAIALQSDDRADGAVQGAAGNGLGSSVDLVMAFHAATADGAPALIGPGWHDVMEAARAGGGGELDRLKAMTVSIHTSAQVGFYTYGSLLNFSPFRRRTNYYALISLEGVVRLWSSTILHGSGSL